MITRLNLVINRGKTVQKKTFAIRYVSGQPAKYIFPSLSYSQLDQTLQTVKTLPGTHILRVMVWNIYKQYRTNWLSVLQSFSKNAQLVLLQEAQTTPELIQFATSNYLATDQVPALIFPQYSSGVMTLSATHPIYCYPLCEREPLLRLAKSALITIYPMYDKKLLMVINIHAVNFSLGIDVYSKQLDHIGQQICNHNGPVIMAGDFNTWSRRRILALYKFTKQVNLKEVQFIDDHRKKAFNKPLDYVFYRDINVYRALVLVTKASDHNPLLVEFDISSHHCKLALAKQPYHYMLNNISISLQ